VLFYEAAQAAMSSAAGRGGFSFHYDGRPVAITAVQPPSTLVWIRVETSSWQGIPAPFRITTSSVFPMNSGVTRERVERVG